jgi:uncharacterized protein
MGKRLGGTVMLRLYDIKLPLGRDESDLLKVVSDLLEVERERIKDFRVVRRSLDARRERPPEFNYVVELAVSDERAIFQKAEGRLKIKVLETEAAAAPRPLSLKLKKKPVIVGCGPAGLFAALTLAERGTPPILLERGKKVEDRIQDIQAFWERGILNTESNVHFGEGGAGTFSDGKLTTRIKDKKTDHVRKTLVDLGAPSGILIDAKPHVGTDRLRQVLINLRNKLIALGCEVRFQSKMTDVLVRNDRVTGIVIDNEDEIETDHLILAAGQSCTDTYELLNRIGVSMGPKAFAVGARIEHPQELINRIQYGKWWQHKDLPPAEYALTAKIDDLERSVYTFCMCPGGLVIGCSSEEGTIVTNGMSQYRRDGAFANSAVVVNIRIEDLQVGSPLAGLKFRRELEERAFSEAGGNYFAPAQKLTDFLDGGKKGEAADSTFLPGVTPIPLDGVLPGFIIQALRRGISIFEKKMPGFITSEAVLIGVETRTSSAVRILRNERGESVNTAGMYPCGEGSGYAGGIVSSAVDGMKTAEAILAAAAV